MDKKKVTTAVQEALAQKGERKFRQSVDLAINFKDVDFKKAENRVSLDVILPHQPRDMKVAVFADPQLQAMARQTADLVIMPDEIPSYAQDKKKQKDLLNYAFLASPSLMAVVGKQLGQVLGARGKLPKPIPPNANLASLVDSSKRSITLKTKGKYLPVLHCIIGNEKMTPDDLAENVIAILDAVEKKVPGTQYKSVLVKTTMGKPARISA